MTKTITLAAAILAAMAMPAFADGLSGEWLREGGAARIAFAPCGSMSCGTISWLRDANGPSHVGQQVFFDMTPTRENEWTGQAFNPQDGKTYSGKITLKGDTMVTEGCVLIICKSVTWTRS